MHDVMTEHLFTQKNLRQQRISSQSNQYNLMSFKENEKKIK